MQQHVYKDKRWAFIKRQSVFLESKSMAFVTRGWHKLHQTYFNINIVANVFWNAEIIVSSEWSVCTLVERYRRELEAESKIFFF